MNKLLLIGFCIFLTACSTWSKVSESRISSENKSFSIAAPGDWLRADFLNTNLKVSRTNGGTTSIDIDRIVLTRNGLALERIEVARLPATEAFPHIEQGATESHLASELANFMIADMKKSGDLNNLEVEGIAPDNIAGHNGFRVHARYANAKGLYIERLYYGFVKGKDFYYLAYEAPKLHYFYEYVEDFIGVVNSLQLTGKS